MVTNRDIAKNSAPNEIFVNPNQTLNDLSRTSVSLWLALLIYPSLLGMSIPMLYQVRAQSVYTIHNELLVIRLFVKSAHWFYMLSASQVTSLCTRTCSKKHTEITVFQEFAVCSRSIEQSLLLRAL
jgi:hypothetical protein